MGVNRWETIFYFCMSVTVALYGWALTHYMLNLPYWDDYNAILEFLNAFYTHDGVGERLELLFAQHNEHRIVFTRMISVVQASLWGEVNFIQLIVIGNMGLLGILYLVWRHARDLGIPFSNYVPVVIVLVSLSHYEVMTWAMTSIQQYYQIVFALLAIGCMVRSRTGMALFWTVIALFTGGGGIVLIPLMLLYLLMHRRYQDLAMTALLSGGVLYLYFVALGYHRPAHHPPLMEDIGVIVEYMLLFLGSIGASVMAAMVIAVGVLVGFVSKMRESYKTSPFFFWSILFVLATAGASALARGGFGIEQALSSRYTLYSLLLIVLVYLQSWVHYPTIRSEMVLGMLIVAFGIFVFWLPKGIEGLEKQYQERLHSPLIYPDVRIAADISEHACQNALFTKGIGGCSASFFDQFRHEQPLTPTQVLSRSLAYMMRSDGRILEEEIHCSVGALHTLGDVRTLLHDGLKKSPKSDLETFIVESDTIVTPQQKVLIGANMLDLMWSDGRVAPQEEEIMRRWIDGWGISPKKLQEIEEVLRLKNKYSLLQKPS